MPPPDLKRLEQHLAANRRPRHAIVFGSMANGTARADSDLDLPVDIRRPLTSEERLALIADLASFCGRPVNMIDLRTVGEPLLGQILQQGQRLLGTHADFGDLIARHFAESADFLPPRRRVAASRTNGGALGSGCDRSQARVAAAVAAAELRTPREITHGHADLAAGFSLNPQLDEQKVGNWTIDIRAIGR